MVDFCSCFVDCGQASTDPFVNDALEFLEVQILEFFFIAKAAVTFKAGEKIQVSEYPREKNQPS